MALKLKGSTSGFVAIDAPSVAGNNTLILPDSAGSAGQILANDITAGVTTFTSVTVNRNGDLTVPGTISIGGTLTYEDVTSIDSIGIITARSTIDAQGDVSIADKIIHTGDTNTAIRFPAADTFTVETSGSERMRVTSAGKIGIGSAVPTAAVDIASGSNSYFKFGQDADNPKLEIFRTTGNASNTHYGAELQLLTGDFTFSNAPGADLGSHSYTERLRIDSGGRLLVNHSSGLAPGSFSSKFAIEDTNSAASISITRNSANNGAPVLIFGKSRGTSVGSNTAVQANDQLGEIRFYGADGTDRGSFAALIKADVDGTPGSNDMPGRLVFSTTADGGVAATERMRINSLGQISIRGTTTAFDTTGDLDSLQMYYETDSGQASIGPYSSGGNTHLSLYTNASGAAATEKVRISSDGRVSIGVNPSVIQALLNVKTDSSDGTQPVVLRLGNDSSGSGTGAAMVMGAGAGATSQGVTLAGFYDGTGTTFTVGTNASFNGSTTERFRISANGDVRVGGGSPATFGSGTTILETYNANTYTANLVTSGTHQLQMIASQTHGATSIGTRSNHNLNLSANDSTKVTITTAGLVGINETSPINLLTISNTSGQNDVIGNLQIRYTGTAATANSGLTVKNYNGTSQQMQWETNGVRIGNRIVTNSGNGHVYITAGNDTVRLSINASTGNFAGSSSADISDGRLKENITSISNATATIKQLLGKTFTWKEEAKLGTDTKYGFIAQELKTVLPDLVYQDVGINRVSKDADKQGYGQGEIVDDYSDDYKNDSKSEWSMAVNTSGIIPVLVEAFKELEARIAALEG